MMAKKMYWMKTMVADELADTAELTAAELGGYYRLQLHYWRNHGPLPDDDMRLARLAGMTTEEWEDARPAIAEFFEILNELWMHPGLDQEFQKALDVSKTRSVIGQQGGKASAKARKQKDQW